MSSELPDQSSTLGLPSPPTAEEASKKLDLSSGVDSVTLDHLGPLVVNKDGSLGRITNWDKMTDGERKSTLKILGKRNKERLKALEDRKQEPA